MPRSLTLRRSFAPRPGSSISALRMAIVLAVALCLVVGVAPAWLQAATGPKVVVVVGPVGRFTSGYKSEAREVIAEARRHTSNVVAVFTPKATWSAVRAAAQGASIFVYFGHGWGYPSTYAPYDADRMNGMALDPVSNADSTRRVYYGESRVRGSIRLAPGAAVLLYRLCYASGNTEPGLSEGTTNQSRRRVDGFGAGFLDTGAAIVIADGHPSSPGNYVHQLFATDRAMSTMFRSAPNYHHHQLGPYASVRTPGAWYMLDPDRAGSDPKGFYRSIVGDLTLRTTQVTGRAPYPAVSPSPSPSDSPSAVPSEDPSSSADPSSSDEASPSADPTPEPTPSTDATAGPSVAPSADPTPSPSPEDTASPVETAPPMDPSPSADPTAPAESPVP